MNTNTDYADEFSSLKKLHEDNLGRKFTDEEFNEIFAKAMESSTTELFRAAQNFENELVGLLTILHETTMQWEKEVKKLTPREAAEDFIRPYLLDGDTFSLRPDGELQKETEIYSAHIEEYNVVVTKLYGEEIQEPFHLQDIMSDIIYELAQELKKDESKK